MHLRCARFACRERRCLDQPLDHRRRREEQAALETGEERHDLVGVESARLRDDVDCAARHVRHDVKAGTVRQRRRMQERVTRGDRLDVGHEALRHREQVAVRDLHALRTSRGAAGVEQPGRRIRVHRRPARRAAGAPPSARARRCRARCNARAMRRRRPPSAACHAASAKAQRAPLSPSTNASSFGCSFALTGTATSPAHQHANSVSMYAGLVARRRSRRDPRPPGRRRACRPRAPPPVAPASRSRAAPVSRARPREGAATCARFAPASSRGCASRPSVPAPADVLHDLACRVATGNAGDAAARMRARSAQVEAGHRHPVVRRGRARAARRKAGRATARRERYRRRSGRIRARGRAATARGSPGRSLESRARSRRRWPASAPPLPRARRPRYGRRRRRAGRGARAGRRGSPRASPPAPACRRPSTG